MKKILLLMAMALPFVLISCGDDKDEPESPDNHEYVDLGLPSGTLWATCNVGASSPEDYGDHFAWGETVPKEVYEWSTYKWISSDNNGSGYTKYCTNRSDGFNGFVDNKAELELEDDAAYVKWGKNWRIPSIEQMKELVNSCSWQSTTRNGVNGQLVTGPNGNTMFLPAADQHHQDYGMGYYMSRTLHSNLSNFSYSLFLVSEDLAWVYGVRYFAQTVRAVHIP